jgi:AbrB family looped-hinge helix DNA binding protein
MIMATLTSKGQVTLPKALRRELQLEQGDRVVFERGPDGWLLTRRTADGRKSDGAAKPFVRRREAMSITEMKQAAGKAAGAHYRRGANS